MKPEPLSKQALSRSKTGSFLFSTLITLTSAAQSTGPALASESPEYSPQVTHESSRKIHESSKGGDTADGQKIASEIPVGAPILPTQDPIPKPKGKMACAVMETTIKAPLPFVWETLTDFSLYPKIFPRIATCKVTKRTGNYVYTESYLKPSMFLRQLKQVIVNDLNGKPHVLRWGMIEGNFDSSQGCWELTPEKDGKSCHVKYTLESTTDPIPRAIAGFTMKFIQKDIVKTFKDGTESLYHAKESGNNVAVSPDSL